MGSSPAGGFMLQSTPNNSNLQGKNVRVVGSSSLISGAGSICSALLIKFNYRIEKSSENETIHP